MADLNTLPLEDDPERLRQLAMLQPQPLTPAVQPRVGPSNFRNGHSDLELAEANDRTTPQPVPGKLKPITSPEIGGTSAAPESGLQPIGQKSPVKTLSFAERQALPLISPGTPAGSSAFYQNKLERAVDRQENPWGSAENHPGFLGKLAHVGARIGNVAGDVLAPGTMALIPGTDLNNRIQEGQDENKFAGARHEEDTVAAGKSKQALEEKKEASEEPLREAQTENLSNKDSEALAKLGMMRDEHGNITADPTSPVHQKQQMAQDAVKNLMDLRGAQKELAEARTEVEHAKNDPNSPAFKAAQQRLAMAQYAHDLAAKNLDLHQQQFGNKLQEQELLKPSGQAQSRGSAAQAVLSLMPDLDKLVRSNAKEMGPLMGRINRGEIAIGNVDPKVAELYSAMKSFYALQPAVHGFRNAEFVKDFEHALGTLERDPEAFLAGMHGLEPTMKAVANEGKTFHKRIVEGGGTPPAAGGGFAAWDKSNPK